MSDVGKTSAVSRKVGYLVLLVVTLGVAFSVFRYAGDGDTPGVTPVLEAKAASGTTAVSHPRIAISTQTGVFILELYPEQAPRAVSELVELIRSGYYADETVIESRPGLGFVLAKVGKSARGFTFADEQNALVSARGSVAISKSTASQAYLNNIFIGYGPQPELEQYYTIIGRLLGGIERAEQLSPATLYRVEGVTLMEEGSEVTQRDNG